MPDRPWCWRASLWGRIRRPGNGKNSKQTLQGRCGIVRRGLGIAGKWLGRVLGRTAGGKTGDGGRPYCGMRGQVSGVEKNGEGFRRRLPGDPVPTSISGVERWLRDALGSPPDLVTRRLRPAMDPDARILIAYLSSLVPKGVVAESVVRPLVGNKSEEGEKRYRRLRSPSRRLEYLGEALIETGELEQAGSRRAVLEGVCRGQTAIFLEGSDRVLLAGTRAPRGRAIDEPTLEASLRGPHDGLTEDLESNLAQVRRRLPHPDLQVFTLQVGDISHTRVAVVYLQNVARPDLIRGIVDRLERIRIDGVLDTGYLEDHMFEARFRLFPMVLVTERPDRVVGNLLEGRAAILVDGSPSALVLPLSAGVMLQAADDYYLQPAVATMARLMRFVGILASLTLPALYVALVSFHQELIPTTFFARVAAGREGIPVSSLGEAFLMGAAFEILREAGSRLPRQVGQAVSVVGAVVVGEAATRASLISPLMLIVTAVTAIASFLVPFYAGTAVLWLPRMLLTLLAGMFGLVGLSWGFMVGLYYLSALRSFGVPYLSPAAPLVASDLKDFLARVPWRAMVRRPREPGSLHPQRKGSLPPAGPAARTTHGKRERP